MKNTVPKAHEADERDTMVKTTCYLEPSEHKAYMNYVRDMEKPYRDKPSLFTAELIRRELRQKGLMPEVLA